MSKINKGRRQFLKNSGQSGALALSGPALNLLIQGLVNGIVQNAKANSINSSIKNYVHLQFPGAPPRWMYDLLLAPWEGDSNKLIANTSVATHFSGPGPYDKTAYSLTQSNTQNGKIYLPYMWKYKVPTSQGNVPMKNLLNNMAVIRGIDMEINSHRLNRIRQHQPTPGQPCIGGLIADHTKRLIHGIHFDHSQPFVSANNYKPMKAQFGGNSLNKTLSDLMINRTGSIKKLHENYRSAMENAIGQLNKAANIDPRTSEVVAKNRVNAELILRRGFNNIDDFWNEAFPRYKKIIEKVIAERKSSTLKKITDKPIVANASNPKWTEINKVVLDHEDYRNVLDNKSSIKNMAESFAIIEFLLKQGLTAFMSASMRPFSGLKRTSNTHFDMKHDLHSGGTIIVTYLMSLYYRAFSGCLLELIRELKSTQSPHAEGNLFDNTLINVTSEFNRSPLNNGAGSDHGVDAHSITLYGGMLNGPLVLGNIKKQPPPTEKRYTGTWGQTAETEWKNSGDKFTIRIGHVGETILTLLGPLSSSVNASPLMNSKGQPLVKKAKII